jgi:hypothetical protein
MQGCGFPLIQLAARLFHPVLGNRRDIFRPFFVFLATNEESAAIADK